MKKVGIASCYYQQNYGSILQALATQMALDKLGYDNETIDISGFACEIKKSKVLYFAIASLTSGIFLTKFGRAKSVVAQKLWKTQYCNNISVRKKAFERFEKRYFKKSTKYYSKKELGKNCSVYQAVLVGSDQLWLPSNIAADYYTLSFVPTSVNSIAYATSFGQSDLPKCSIKKAKEFLRQIRHIGIREESGKKIVKELVNRNVPVVCDPTLLFTSDEWMYIQEKETLIKEPYIFCYFLGSNMLHRDFARKLKKETGCKIVALIHLDEYQKNDEGYADYTPYDIEPGDFLCLVRNAEYICTDSFHCSVFSMLFKKTFFTFRRYTKKTSYSTNSRLDTLFDLAGIKGRIFEGDEDIQKSLEDRINYNEVHNNLAKIREKSYRYLVTALEDKESTDCD